MNKPDLTIPKRKSEFDEDYENEEIDTDEENKGEMY